MNRTAAVSVVNVDATLDMYGDLYISGSLINNATRPISSVTVLIDIYNIDGVYLGQTYADVYPSWLDVGKKVSLKPIIMVCTRKRKSLL